MGELAVVTREAQAPVAVPDSVIEEYLISFGNKLKDYQRKQFVQICRAFQLNPFIREIYGVQYGDNFNIIVGYEVYLKRAERSGMLTGWRAWTEGTGDGLKGCIEINRRDWTQPFYHEVYFSEYDQKNSMWKSKPHTMIKKVAIAQGFRMAFPEELGEMPYTADEIPLQGGEVVNRSTGEITSGKPDVKPPQSKSGNGQQSTGPDGPINENQKKLIYVKLKQSNITDEAFCKFYEIESVSALPAKLMNEALSMIAEKKIPPIEEKAPGMCPECREVLTDGKGHAKSCPNAEPG